MGQPSRLAVTSLSLLLALLCCLAGRADLLDSLERGIGDMVTRGMEECGGLWHGPRTAALLGTVSTDLFALRSRDFPYTLRVVDNYQVNAITLPGGHIFVYRGLLAHADSVEEVVGVVAHEMGHLEDRDFQRVVGRQLLWWGVAGLLRRGGEDSAANVSLLVGLLNSLRHSRRQEAQADAEGVRLSFLAGYHPAGLVSFLSRIRRHESSWFQRIFLTHPDSQDRRENTEARIAEWIRGNPMAAQRLCLALVARGRPALALRLARECRELPAHRWWAEPEADRLAADVAALADVPVVRPSRHETPRSLYAAVDRIERDKRIHHAIEVGQAIDPEVGHLRYAVALARTLAALVRLQGLIDRGHEAAYRLSFLQEQSEELTACLDKAVACLDGARRGGWILAVALGELIASGPGEPLERLNSARLSGVLAQVQWAVYLIGRAEDSVDRLLHACTRILAHSYCKALADLCAEHPEATALLRGFIDAGARTCYPVTAGRNAPAGAEHSTEQAGDWVEGLRRALEIDDCGCEAVEDVYILAGLAARQVSEEVVFARDHMAVGAGPCGTASFRMSIATYRP
ncbi:MAG: M48 family metalloprotease [Armatimonadota bacterium]